MIVTIITVASISSLVICTLAAVCCTMLSSHVSQKEERKNYDKDRK